MSKPSLATQQKLLHQQNWMHPACWIPDGTTSLLDVGCNTGELLSYCNELFPMIRLAGVEINKTALEQARQRLPLADLHVSAAEELPFADDRFDCVTCIEVLEHISVDVRSQSLKEMRRVLRPGGRLVLRVPHAGMFAFLDPNNFRFRMPHLYKTLIRQGHRDPNYSRESEDVVWHHHFTRDELKELAGNGWQIEASRTGGLLLMPLVDIACWPFYRIGRTDNFLFRVLQRIANFDIGFDYGKVSFDVLMVLRRV